MVDGSPIDIITPMIRLSTASKNTRAYFSVSRPSEAEIIKLYVDNLLDDGHYNEGANNNYLETVYQTTYQIGQQCYEEGLSYIIFDLGIWNTSAVRYMNISEHGLDALMIDATTDYSPAFSSFMKRDYSRALQEWVNDWCQQPAVTMPQIRSLGDDYITHDIPKTRGIK